MGCGASQGSSATPQDKSKDGKDLGNAVGVVPVAGNGSTRDGAAFSPTDGDKSAAQFNGRPDGEQPAADASAAQPAEASTAAAAQQAETPRSLTGGGTMNRLYHTTRLGCPFEDGEPGDRKVLWNLLRGQTVVPSTGPPPEGEQPSTPHAGRVVSVACDFGNIRVRLTEDEAQLIPARDKDAPETIADPLDLTALQPVQILGRRCRRAAVCGVNVRHVTGHGRAVKTVGLSGDGRLLVSGDGIDVRQALRCVDVRSATHVGTLNGYRGGSGEAPCDLSFSTNGQQLATCDQSDTLLLWDMTTFRCKKSLQFEGEDGNELFLVGVRLAPDGKVVAAAAEQSDEEGVSRGRVVLWDLEAKQQRLMFAEHTASVLCLSFSPCSTLLASGGRDGQLYIWRVEDGSVVHKLSGHTSGIRSCHFSYDGTLLLTNDAKVLCLWGVESGRPRLTRHIDGRPRRNLDPTQARAENDQSSKTRYMVSQFIAGGLLLIAASDKQVRLLDAATGAEAYVFSTKAPVSCASSASRAVALGDVWGNVYIAELDVRAIGPLLDPPLTAEQAVVQSRLDGETEAEGAAAEASPTAEEDEAAKAAAVAEADARAREQAAAGEGTAPEGGDAAPAATEPAAT
eukprot:TRINITY_DN64814_c0_g1_i1.p1 TRINITY_DN64814_c0_g1~~TRINITY_DN64814_c0_g1_i1.p1  ORF type:complete len:624 (+),score=158.15 TRINITY_DN64814_c0_g1_i1:143-2014(+)